YCLAFAFVNASGFGAVSLGRLRDSEGAGHALGARVPHGDPQDPHRLSLLRGLVCDQGGAEGTRRPGRGSRDPGSATPELCLPSPAIALIASGMGRGKGRLQFAAVLICALCLFFGFTIAVALSKPLW